MSWIDRIKSIIIVCLSVKITVEVMFINRIRAVQKRTIHS